MGGSDTRVERWVGYERGGWGSIEASAVTSLEKPTLSNGNRWVFITAEAQQGDLIQLATLSVPMGVFSSVSVLIASKNHTLPQSTSRNNEITSEEKTYSNVIISNLVIHPRASSTRMICTFSSLM